MEMFGDWEDEYYDDSDSGWLFSNGDKQYPDGHPKSAYKDDGDMKLFKDDEE